MKDLKVYSLQKKIASITSRRSENLFLIILWLLPLGTLWLVLYLLVTKRFNRLNPWRNL